MGNYHVIIKVLKKQNLKLTAILCSFFAKMRETADILRLCFNNNQKVYKIITIHDLMIAKYKKNSCIK